MLGHKIACRIHKEILALSIALPEDKRTVCLDQTQEAMSRSNIQMLEKIRSRVKELVEGRELVEEGKVEVEVVSDPIVSETQSIEVST